MFTQHVNVGVLGGRWVGDVWCCSPPCCEYPLSPVEMELTLGGTALEPMEAHPNHFDPALDYCVADEARSSQAVHLRR